MRCGLYSRERPVGVVSSLDSTLQNVADRLVQHVD